MTSVVRRSRRSARQQPGVLPAGAWFLATLLVLICFGRGTALAAPEVVANLPSMTAQSQSVAEVVFPPELSYSRAELLRWMDLQPRSRRQESEFSNALWRSDLDRLELFYVQEGFDLAEVAGFVERDPQRGVVLHVRVEEGPRWHWIRTGLEVHPQRSTLRDSLAVLVPAPGDPARWRVLPRLRESLLGALAEWGHLDANVEFLVRRDPADRNAELRVVIHTGPRIRTEGLRIDGLDKTDEEVVRREIVLRDGDLLLPSDLRRSENRLRMLGIFDDVVVEPAPSSHRPGFRGVRVRAVEMKAGRFGTGAGYGSIDRLHFGASVEQGNLSGRAIRVQLGGVVGQQRRKLEAGAFVPWFLGRRVGLRLATFYEKRFPSRYEIERLGAETSVVRQIDELWKLELGYVAERVRILSSDLEDEREPLHVGKLGVGLSRDSRDRLLGPTRGSYFRVAQDWVSPILGSSEDFTRLKIQLHGHARLGGGFLGNARVLFGAMKSHDSARPIPLPERFFAGGTGDLRGFPADGIGPQDESGVSSGGRILFLSGAELEHRIYRGLGAAGFVDFGQLEDREQDLRIQRLSVGAGGGLRWRSRIGYARADVGFPLTDRFGEAPHFHFSTGTTFF